MEQKSHLIFEVEPSDPAQDLASQELTSYDTNQDAAKELKVRLDKWLWAARFFKTRALARSAIEQGNVYYDGQKTIASKEIAVGASLIINQGKMRKIVIIRQLSTRRRSTDEANALFEELARGINQQLPNHDTAEVAKSRKMVRFLRRNASTTPS